MKEKLNKRMQIFIGEGMAKRLRNEAFIKHTSQAKLIRLALEEYFYRQDNTPQNI